MEEEVIDISDNEVSYAVSEDPLIKVEENTIHVSDIIVFDKLGEFVDIKNSNEMESDVNLKDVEIKVEPVNGCCDAIMIKQEENECPLQEDVGIKMEPGEEMSFEFNIKVDYGNCKSVESVQIWMTSKMLKR